MPGDMIERFCPACKQLTMWCRRGYPNHVMHAILSIMTVGFWLPVWLIVTIQAGYRCGRCEATTASSAIRTILIIILVLLILGIVSSLCGPHTPRR